jgi:hypothetical protein
VHNTPGYSKAAENDEFEVSQDKIKIAYVGCFEPHRFIEELISIVMGDSRFELHIGGFGLYEEYVKQCSEKCPYYVSKDAIKLISKNDTDNMLDEIMSYIRRGVESIRDGYDQYDVYCTYDLIDYVPKAKTLGQIIDAQHGSGDKS